jgi:hypothetical protein
MTGRLWPNISGRFSAWNARSDSCVDLPFRVRQQSRLPACSDGKVNADTQTGFRDVFNLQAPAIP